MTIKNKLMRNLGFSVLFGFVVVCVIINFIPTNIAIGLLIFFVVVGLIIIAVDVCEAMYLKHHFSKYELAPNSLIEFCLQHHGRMFVYSSELSIKTTLITQYLIIGEVEKAREIINTIDSHREFNKYLLFPRIIIALYDNDIEKAIEYQTELDTQKEKFANQKGMALGLIKVVKDKTFDEGVYNKTVYKTIKDICDRYR